MPVSFITVSRKCYSEIINGADFTGSTSNYGSAFKGSVMERVKMDITLNLEWYTSMDGDFWINDTGGGTANIKRKYGSFVEDGWQTGDTATYVGGNSNFTARVSAITVDIIYFDTVSGVITGNPNNLDGDFLRGTTSFADALLSVGIIENNNPISFVSLQDGSDMSYIKEAMTGSLTDMIRFAGPQSWIVGDAQIRLVGVTSYVQQFQFTQEIIINPFYRDDFITDFENGTVPQLLKGLNSLKYVFRLEVRNAMSNPNLYKRIEEGDTLGSVGWYGENYNGFKNNYSITSINYSVASVAQTQLFVEDITTVTIVVAASSNIFVVGQPFVLYHAKAPTAAEYEANNNLFVDNFLYDSVRVLEGASTSGLSGVIKSVSSVVNSPTQLTITATIEYSTAQQDLIGSDYKYILAVGVGNGTKTTEQSDKVILLADYNTFEQGTDIPGLLTENSLTLWNHPTDDTDPGFTDYKGWIEDGVLAKNNFSLHLDQGAEFKRCKFQLVAYNPITGHSFILQEYEFSLANQSLFTQGGYDTQQISLDTTRGFKLAANDQFNRVRIETGSYAANDISYEVQVGFKVDWQSWIALPGAAAVFSQKTKDASLYSLQQGYEIRGWFVKNISGTNYIGSTPALPIYDYDLDDNTTPAWTGAMTLYDEDSNVVPAILVGRNTRMDIVWTPASGDTGDWPGYWAIHRIEQFQATGYSNIEEFSSVRTPVSTGVLQPTAGFTLLEVDIVTGTVTTSCIIDGTKLTGNARYKLSGRLGIDGSLDPPLAEYTGDTTDVELGTIDVGIDFTAGFGSLGDDDIVTLELYIDNGVTETLVETMTGFLNDSITTFVSVKESAYSTKQSFVLHTTGTVEASGTLVWDRYSWAVANSWINLTAKDVRLTLKIKQAGSGLTSVLDDTTLPAELQPPEYTLETRYLQNDDDYIYSATFSADTETAARLSIADGWSEVILTSPNSNPITSVWLDPDIDTVMFAETDLTTQAANKIYRATKLGTSPYAFELLASNFAANGKYCHMITRDDKRSANGEGVYWLGMSETSDQAAHLLYMLYYDGSAWQLVNFTTKVAAVVDDTATRVEVNLTFDGVCYLAKNGNTVGNERAMLRMVQSSGTDTTVADFIDLGNWDDATVMCGNVAGGAVDGTGSTAKFKQVQNIIMLEDDGTRPTVLWVTDRNNHTIRQLAYESGTDNYSVTTVVGVNGTSGDTDDTGTAARFNLPSGMCTNDQANIYIGDSNNHVIRKVTYPGLVVTTLSGTGDDAFRLGTLY